MKKVVTLGEIMLRLSTAEGTRIPLAENMNVHYGGGEANVAISLVNYGHEVTFASKVPDHGLGVAVKKHLQRFGVNCDALLFGGSRLGTYYMETGVGERATDVIYDRSYSSFATMTELEWDLDALFNNTSVFHISGITAALTPTWQKLTLQLVKEAKKRQVKVSFDVNYRGKLWSQKEAGAFLKELLPYVDYCSAGKMDALYLLGVTPYKGEANPQKEETYYYQEMQKAYPNIEVFYSTSRTVHSASNNELRGTIFIEGNYYQSPVHYINPIVDRVGGGDAFSGGILHGLLTHMAPQEIINFATAASALKHTVAGDCNQFTRQEVESFMALGSGKINR